MSSGACRRMNEAAPGGRNQTSRSGSALIMVLGVVMLLALLITGFGYELRGELKAAGSFYEEAQNQQLARSALVLAQQEVARDKASPYADAFGNICFVQDDENAEDEIEELLLYRSGWTLGRGKLSYRLIVKPFALDLNELTQVEWSRLFEVACRLDEGDERDALVDAILDWRDSDDLPRAFGAEEEVYQELDPPSHVRNGDFETIEELLLVEGMAPDLLFGAGHPVFIEDGMLFGGGLYRFLIGDNCPEAQASAKYILQGILPADDEADVDEEEEGGFEKLDPLPAVIYLVAEGFVPDPSREETVWSIDALSGTLPPSEPAALSRHIILVTLVLPDGSDSQEYVVDDFQMDAAGELLEQILAYGVPEEETYEP